MFCVLSACQHVLPLYMNIKMFHSKKKDQPLCKMHSFILSGYFLVNVSLSTPAELCLDISRAGSAVRLEKEQSSEKSTQKKSEQ